jgi:glycerophosphoryl diester phosphodiesterase
MSRWTYLDCPTPFGLAHRGAHGPGVPENTMAAFQAAVDLGFRYVETDVHATADGVLVAFHDHTLDRVTDRTGRIADLPWEQVRQARVGGTQTIPLLADVLGTWPDLRLNIDVKHDSGVGPTLDVLARTQAYPRVCVGSFSRRRTRALRAALPPGTATAYAPAEVALLRAAIRQPRLLRRLPGDVPCVQVPVEHQGVTIVDEELIAAAHGQGCQVHVWTINDEAQMRRLLALGVDALVTDEARLLAEVLASEAAR